MGSSLFKYAGPDVIAKALREAGICSFRCSLPREFNDPYELFLTIDYGQPPDVLAYYKEVIGEMPQRATTCFSKSPAVIPMWAHYAHDHRGVVIEIDEELLSEYRPNVGFGDVDYQDEPHAEILDQIHHALMTCKPRHVYMLQRAILSAAYYTKGACWSYEQERRLVAPLEEVEELGGIMLLKFPTDCITSLIVGHRASDETQEAIQRLAQQIDCSYRKLHIGRSSARPFFKCFNDEISVFEDGRFVDPDNCCASCREPISTDHELCGWCSIQDAHEVGAAKSNPMRMLDKLGHLQEYYEGMSRIDRGEEP